MFNQLLHYLTQMEQRCLLWVKGEQAWARSQVSKWINEAKQPLTTTWFGEHKSSQILPTTSKNQQLNQTNDIRIKQYKKMLGQETDILVYDAYAGLNPDALGALVGTVKQGGLCILISPDEFEWIDYVDPEYNRLCVEPYKPEQISHFYIQYFIQQLQQSKHVLSVNQQTLLDQNTFEKKINTWFAQNIKMSSNNTKLPDFYNKESEFNLCKTQDQYHVVRSLYQLNKSVDVGINSRAVVLQSDRGRGKSSALGLFAGLVLSQVKSQSQLQIQTINVKQSFNITLTAPHSTSVTGVFEFCQQVLQQNGIKYTVNKNKLMTDAVSLNVSSLTFVAPDELENSIENTDLILVDEAAAIPTQMLLPLITQKKNAVFATTIHGYEGTGRGFEYKFKPLLNKHYDEVEHLTLKQPIRWQDNDFLEADIDQLLMINTHLPDVSKKDINTENVYVESLTPKQLIQNTPKLTELFSLLVNAHYQTTPNDLRNLLDGPNIRVFSLQHNDTIIGAVLLAKEGQIEPVLAEQIWQGKRRPKGHLLPQSLLAHSGFKQAGNYQYGRIIRIAIHPELQGKGFGSLLLKLVREILIQQGFDFLATSFGMSENLIRFWQKNELTQVRLGLKPEASTGEYSLFMTQALNNNVVDFQQQLESRFHDTLKVEQQCNLRGKTFVNLLCQQTLPSNHPQKDKSESKLTTHDKNDLVCFSYHYKSLDTCLLAMSRFINFNPHITFPDLVLDKVINGLTNVDLIKKYELTGEKQLVQRLRLEWQQLLENSDLNKPD